VRPSDFFEGKIDKIAAQLIKRIPGMA